MSFSSTVLILFACLLSHRCTAYHHSAAIRKSASSQSYRNSVNGFKNVNNYRMHPVSFSSTKLQSKVENKDEELEVKEPSAFDQVASKGLAGVLAIAAAEA
jgi:hypothetical protein